MGSYQSLPQCPKTMLFYFATISLTFPQQRQPYHSLCWNIYHNAGNSKVDSSFRRELRFHPPEPSSCSRWEWSFLTRRGGDCCTTEVETLVQLRLPEAIPVSDADQADTPSLCCFIQRCLHLFTHRTAKFKTLPHHSEGFPHLVASSRRAREGL